MPVIKKNFIKFIYKEKPGTVTKLKLVQKKRNQKFKMYNQLYFGTLVLASTGIVEITHNKWTSFKTLAPKKATTWWLKQSQSNNKLLWKVMSSSYHIK